MGCGNSAPPVAAVYTREEVVAGLSQQQPGLERIKMMSENVAVVIGTGWIFNPAGPIDPALARRLESHSGSGSYGATMEQVASAFVDVYEGLDKIIRGSQETVMAETHRRWGLAEKAINAALAEINQNSGLQYTTDPGRTAVAVTDIKNVKVGVGDSKAYKAVAEKTVSQETHLYVVFPEGEASAPKAQGDNPNGEQAATPAAKIAELKGLLDVGAISQAEFEAKKAELLARM